MKPVTLSRDTVNFMTIKLFSKISGKRESQYEKVWKELIKNLFKNDGVVWPCEMSSTFEAYFFRELNRNGLLALVQRKLLKNPQQNTWPEGLIEKLNESARHEAIYGIWREQALDRIFNILEHERVEYLLMKGAALSLTHYPEPYLRPRADTDLLISPKQVQRVKQILKETGYEFAHKDIGNTLRHQMDLIIPLAENFVDRVDVHWNVFEPLLFSNFFTFEELYAESIPVTVGNRTVFVPNAIHGMLLSCVHRVAHHRHEDRLIWHYDTHLLVDDRPESWFSELLDTAEKKRVVSICVEGLSLAHQWFATSVPEKFLCRKPRDQKEHSENFMRMKSGLGPLLISNIFYAPSWIQKFRVLGETFFPAPDYMIRRYKIRHTYLLPFYYLFRIVAGLPKAFRG